MLNATRFSLLASLFIVGGCAGTGMAPSGADNRLLGTWQVVEIAGRPVVADSQVTLAFDKEGRLSGNTSCNGFGAPYTLSGGDRISIPRPVMTMRACLPALMDQEGRLITLLEQVTTYRINGAGALVLSTASNQTLTARLR